jgi:hypothetical protein
MTLAAILYVGMFVSASGAGLPMRTSQSSEQSPPPAKPAESSAAQNPDAAPPSQTPDSAGSATQSLPASAPAPTTPVQAKPPIRKRHHKKLTKVVNCPVAPATPAIQPPADTSAPVENSSTPPSPAKTSTDCPPAKVVIRNGGASEPSIQLTGGAGGNQAKHQRSTTEQLLGATEDNLKKMAGRQLTASQQEVVNQIHQFMDQSKAAVAAGDTERGRNLALKARLLSDELLKL